MANQTAAEKILANINKRQRKIVDRVMSDGSVYKFREPFFSGTIISELPTTLADEAEAEWRKDGVGLILTDDQIAQMAAAESDELRQSLQAEFEAANIAEFEAKQTAAQRDREAERQTTALILRKLRLMELSVSPKLVQGIANPKKDEMSFDQMPDDHLQSHLQWLQAGGSELVREKMFPQSAPASSGIGDYSEKLRKTRKQFGRAK